MSDDAAPKQPAAPAKGGGETANGHPGWYRPAPPSENAKLRVFNTLTGRKDEFVTNDPLQKEVTGYICGPTVYNVSHVGHARSFVSFDIIRRVMEDYFGYSVFYVMNITDIDDKIILRARRNHLVKRFQDSKPELDDVLAKSAAAFEYVLAKRRKAVAEVEAEAASLAGKQGEDDAKTRVRETTIKLTNVESARKAADAALEEAKAAGKGKDALVAAYLEHAAETLSEHLDLDQGAGVTDHSIFREHARHYEREFFEDMHALGVRDPTAVTRVSEYIPQVISFVEKIIENGFAYESNGSVYFSTGTFDKSHDYCKLAPQSRNNEALLAEGEGALAAGGEKRNATDFALWKKSKPGEPSWESPWGGGRPGWHVECSVMASDHLGMNFDFHAGGEDLKFPHHDNELAQSEAHFGCQQWCNYFLHAGHLHIEGLKMSKSLKNFITIREALEKHTARQIRLLFLFSPWNGGLNFGSDAMAEVCAKEKTFSEFFLNVRAAQRAQADLADADQYWNQTDREMHGHLREAKADVHEALLDSFDTPRAMHRLIALVNQTNKYLSATSRDNSQKNLVLQRVAQYVDRMLRVFGVIGDRELGFQSGGAGGAGVSDEARLAPFLDTMAAFRDRVRLAAIEKQPLSEIMRLCDEVRDKQLREVGVRLEDRPRPQPAVWKLVDPEELRKEAEAEAAAAREKALRGLRNKLNGAERDLKMAEAAAVPPADLFKDATKYSGWDEQGLPTKDGEGADLSKKGLKNAKKQFDKQAKAHAKHTAAVEKNPNHLADLAASAERFRKEIAELESEQ